MNNDQTKYEKDLEILVKSMESTEKKLLKFKTKYGKVNKDTIIRKTENRSLANRFFFASQMIKAKLKY